MIWCIIMHVTKIQRRKAFMANFDRILSPLTIIILTKYTFRKTWNFSCNAHEFKSNYKISQKRSNQTFIWRSAIFAFFAHFIVVLCQYAIMWPWNITLFLCTIPNVQGKSTARETMSFKGARAGWGLRALGFEKCFKKTDMIPHKKPAVHEPVPRSRKPVTWRFYLKPLLNYTSH